MIQHAWVCLRHADVDFPHETFARRRELGSCHISLKLMTPVEIQTGRLCIRCSIATHQCSSPKDAALKTQTSNQPYTVENWSIWALVHLGAYCSTPYITTSSVSPWKPSCRSLRLKSLWLEGCSVKIFLRTFLEAIKENWAKELIYRSVTLQRAIKIIFGYVKGEKMIKNKTTKPGLQVLSESFWMVWWNSRR